MGKSVLLSNELRTEIIKFVFFILVLLVFSAIFAGLRVEHSELMHADSGLSQADIESIKIKTDFTYKIIHFAKRIITMDLGTISGESVVSHLLNRFLPTLHLAIFSVVIGSAFAVLLSMFSVFFSKSWFTNSLVLICNIILSTPVFVASVLLLIIFFSVLNLFPPGGYENWNSYYVILPGTALGVRIFGRLYLFTNIETFKEYTSPYVMILRTRGFSEKRIIFHHVFRKVIPVVLIYILLDFSSILSGAMIVEEIFFFPGIGKSMYSAIKNMDENLLQALLFYTGMIFYIFNRLAYYLQNQLKGKAV